MSGHDRQAIDKQSAASGVLARLWWMLLGNAVLAFSIIFIFENKRGFFHAADVVFWITVATLVLVRYLDIRFLHGQTATGAPASTHQWVKYVAWLMVCSTLAWVSAHAANYLFVSHDTTCRGSLGSNLVAGVINPLHEQLRFVSFLKPEDYIVALVLGVLRPEWGTLLEQSSQSAEAVAKEHRACGLDLGPASREMAILKEEMSQLFLPLQGFAEKPAGPIEGAAARGEPSPLTDADLRLTKSGEVDTADLREFTDVPIPGDRIPLSIS